MKTIRCMTCQKAMWFETLPTCGAECQECQQKRTVMTGPFILAGCASCLSKDAEILRLRKVVEAARRAHAGDIKVRAMDDPLYGDITVTCYDRDYIDLILAIREYDAALDEFEGGKSA